MNSQGTVLYILITTIVHVKGEDVFLFIFLLGVIKN